jgi:hypothetical protein
VRKLATADRVPQDQVSALEGVQQAPLREEVIGSGHSLPAEYSRLTVGLPRHGTCEQMPQFCAAA